MAPRIEGKPVRWIARCECGTVKEFAGAQFYNSNTRSCGCLKREMTVARNIAGTTHGQSHSLGIRAPSPTYRTWMMMIQRCCNPKHQAFARYGGRGITVCDRWRESFEAFEADVGTRPNGLTLDRVDNSKGYEPGNCRWATRMEQNRNTRSNRMLTLDGETLCLIAWAERYSIEATTISERIKLGWSVRDAITRPKRVMHRRAA